MSGSENSRASEGTTRNQIQLPLLRLYHALGKLPDDLTKSLSGSEAHEDAPGELSGTRGRPCEVIVSGRPRELAPPRTPPCKGPEADIPEDILGNAIGVMIVCAACAWVIDFTGGVTPGPDWACPTTPDDKIRTAAGLSHCDCGFCCSGVVGPGCSGEVCCICRADSTGDALRLGDMLWRTSGPVLLDRLTVGAAAINVVEFGA